MLNLTALFTQIRYRFISLMAHQTSNVYKFYKEGLVTSAGQQGVSCLVSSRNIFEKKIKDLYMKIFSKKMLLQLIAHDLYMKIFKKKMLLQLIAKIKLVAKSRPPDLSQ